MIGEIQWLLDRASESLKAAKLMANNHLYHSAVSEGYYTMFYCAQAPILQKGKNASTHKGVIIHFSDSYIKTNEIDRSFSAMLSNAFAARGKADYEIGLEISAPETETVIADAEQFFQMTLGILQ